MPSMLPHPHRYAVQCIRMAWRRGVNEGLIRAFSNELYARARGKERVRADVDADPSAPVAYWKTEPAPAGFRHMIYLRQTFVDVMTNAKAQTSHRLHLAFGRQVLRHEIQHARRSLDAHGTLDALKAAIDKAGVMFPLWNLLEDSRIEAHERDTSKVPFGWTRFFDITDTGEPTKYLWNLKTNEAAYTGRLAKWTGAAETRHPDTGKNWDTRELIEDFWVRSCDVSATAQTSIDLAAEWQRVFGAVVSKDIPTEGGIGYSKDRGGVDAPTNYNQPMAKGTTENSTQTDLRYFQQYAPDPVTETPEYALRVRTIEQTFSRLQSCRDGQRQRVGMSGNRLHLGNVISGEPNSFRRTIQRGGTRKVVIVFDMSSSMRNQHRLHGIAFLEAVNNLRRRGALDAVLICSGGEHWAVIPKAVSVRDLRRIDPDHGCESIRTTLAELTPTLQAADTVLVYTDGHLTDGDVDAGAWRQRGVDLIGVCACTPVNERYLRSAMDEHFGRTIVAPDGYQLAVSVLDYITRHQ